MFILDFGKMLMPFTRNSLQSTSSHLSLDGGTWTFLQSAPEQGDAGRDVGLSSRATSSTTTSRSGRASSTASALPPTSGGAGSRNPFRFVGRAVYNFWDTEKGYVPVGTNLGKKSILAIGGRLRHAGRLHLAVDADDSRGDGIHGIRRGLHGRPAVGPGDAKTGETP